jgi:cyclin-dependent kinase-like
MDKYEIIDTIGEGYGIVRTYGTVYKARHKQTGVKFAIKKFKESEDDEHVKKTAIREIRMLKLLKHPNIVTLYEVFRQNKKLYLVFEYVDRTLLEDIENNSNGLDTEQVKKVMYQLLKAISYCHHANVPLTQVIHRDIKPENILITRNGILKLCDFGFARTLTSKSGRYTDYVSTRWYRAPELLVGDTQYGKEVDVWAIGCLFAELFTGVPLFPGDSDIDTLHHIMRLCGASLPEKHVQAFYKNPLYEGIEVCSHIE